MTSMTTVSRQGREQKGLGARPELAPGGDRPQVRPPLLTHRERIITGSVLVSRIVFWRVLGQALALRRLGLLDNPDL